MTITSLKGTSLRFSKMTISQVSMRPHGNEIAALNRVLAFLKNRTNKGDSLNCVR